ncbi:hypothetical protein BKA70DRAFT_1231242 [Coprinopsis sp. MPI-PUGE-AT-0042]|nr:hypothetical protein BKA70DRAFT_1231242 [Coprinopsis sp. MPI-PUGE-AT-0042]
MLNWTGRVDVGLPPRQYLWNSLSNPAGSTSEKQARKGEDIESWKTPLKQPLSLLSLCHLFRGIPSKRSHPPGILSSVEPPVKRQRLSVPHNQGFSAPRLFPSQVPSPPQSPASALSPHHVPVPDATTSSPLSSLSPSPPPSEVEKPTLTIKIKPVRAAGNPPAVQEPKPRTPSEAKTKDFKDDIKVKAEAIVLPPDTIRGYLDGVPTLSVSPPPTTPAVSRDFMRLAYGGSSATLIQKVQPNRDPSHTPAAASGNVRGVRNLLYPQTNMNPAVPRRPGEPGLLFATRPEFVPDASKNERTKGPFTLFGCEKQGGKVRWKYLGEYESECVGKVSGDEFAQQKDAVKSAWGAQVVKKKTGPYVRMRRRIALRKAGRDPDEDEKEGKKKEEGEEEKEETGNDGDTDGEELGEEYATGAPLPSITPEDVIQAFSQGQEGVNVIRLRCTRYDHTFSDDINARWPDYPEMVEEEKESSKTKATSSSKKGKKKAEKGGAVGQSHRGSSSSLISMEADGPQLPAVQCASNGGGDQRGAPGPRTSNSSPPSTAGMADLEQGVEAGYGSDSNDSMRSFYAD